MRHFFAVLAVFLFCFSSVFVYAAPHNGLNVVESIRFLGRNADRESVEIHLNRAITPQFMEIEGKKPRFVFDFADTLCRPGLLKKMAVEGEYVSQIRVGFHGGPVKKTRIVFDLVSGQKLEAHQSLLEAKNILLIDVIVKDGNRETLAPAVQEESKMGDSVPQTAPVSVSGKLDGNETRAKIAEKNVRSVKDKASSLAEVPVHTKQSSAAEPAQKVVAVDSAAADIADHAHAIIQNVSFEKGEGDKKEMLVFRLNGFYPPTVYAGDNKSLQVGCDFLGGELAADIPPMLDVKGEYVKRISLSSMENPKKVKATIDLNASFDYNLKQVFFKDEDMFILMVSPKGLKTK